MSTVVLQNLLIFCCLAAQSNQGLIGMERSPVGGIYYILTNERRSNGRCRETKEI